jgi:hypothetical protein
VFGTAFRGLPVAQTERLCGLALLLEPRKTDAWSFAFTRARFRPGSQCSLAVDGGLLEYLLVHLLPPGKPRGHCLGYTVGIYGKDPARILSLLPCIEHIYQIESGPRHGNIRVGVALRERRFHSA